MKRSQIRNFIKRLYEGRFIIEEENLEESEEFMMAAARAAIDNEKEFSYKGKKYPVSMDQKKASELLQGKK